MARWGVFIDTDTGAPTIESGRVVACSRAMSQVQHALMTEFGSVEGAPDYGASITAPTHLSDTMLRDAERRADVALSSLVKQSILYSYDREAKWSDTGYPQIEVAFSSSAGNELLTWPLGR